MMKKLLLLTAAVFAITVVFAQQRTTSLYQKTYKRQTTDPRDSSIMEFDAVARTADGGYGILGYYETVQNGGDYMLVRTDSLGNVQWVTTYGSDSLEVPTNIRTTSDGGFVFSGWNADATFSEGEMSVSKVNSTGSLQWHAQFGVNGDYEEANDLAVLNNGNVLVVGEAPKGILYAGYTLLITQAGLPEDGQFITSGTTSTFTAVDKTTDGGAIIGGYGAWLAAGGTSFDPLLVKVNAQAQVQWVRRYATAGAQLAYDVKQTADGGYVLAGQHGISTVNPPVQGMFLMKLKANGDTAWVKTYDTRPSVFERFYDLVLAPDGYYILGNVQNDSIKTKSLLTGADTLIFGYNPFLMKVDTAGRFLWAKTYGDTSKTDFHFAMTRGADGGFTLVGQTFGFNNRYGGGYLTHTDRDGNISGNCNIKSLNFTVGSFTAIDSTRSVVVNGGNEVAARIRTAVLAVATTNGCTGTGINTNAQDVHLPENAVALYPNPAFEQLTVELPLNTEGVSTVSIFDISGRQVFRQTTASDKLTVPVSDLARGMYLIKVEKEGKFLTKKFIVEK